MGVGHCDGLVGWKCSFSGNSVRKVPWPGDVLFFLAGIGGGLVEFDLCGGVGGGPWSMFRGWVVYNGSEGGRKCSFGGECGREVPWLEISWLGLVGIGGKLVEFDLGGGISGGSCSMFRGQVACNGRESGRKCGFSGESGREVPWLVILRLGLVGIGGKIVEFDLGGGVEGGPRRMKGGGRESDRERERIIKITPSRPLHVLPHLHLSLSSPRYLFCL